MDSPFSAQRPLFFTFFSNMGVIRLIWYNPAELEKRKPNIPTKI